MPFLPKLLPSSEPMVTVPDTRRLALWYQERQFVCLVMAEIMQGVGTVSAFHPQGWKNNANNWNTWITANWLQTVLICEQDAKQRDAAFKSAAVPANAL